MKKKKQKSENLHVNHSQDHSLQAILFSIHDQDKESALLRLQELKALAQSNNIICQKFFLQSLDKANSKYYIGSGKVKEMKAYVMQNECDLVICDNELRSSQVRNLRKELKCEVIDRSELILDIFDSKAKTKEAKIQIEIAKLKYEMSKLRHMWTHFGRIRGNSLNKGMGETQLEVDRRRTRKKISRLEKKMKEIFRHKNISMKKRNDIFSVALVGYASVGKSTLMNSLSHTDLLVKNLPFSTIQTTTRKVSSSTGSFVLSDTVGFVRRLPEHLLSSFYATLMEIKYADLLIHVVDSSISDYRQCMNVLEDVLKHILSKNSKPIIVVFNKKDKLENVQSFIDSLDDEIKISQKFVCLSSQTGEGLDVLRQMIDKKMKETFKEDFLEVSVTQGRVIHFIHESGQVLSQKQISDEKILFHIAMTEKKWILLKNIFKSDSGL